MILFKEAATLSNYLNQLKGQGKTIGFVPTMGALHDGHLSLVESARQQSDLTVCSIFVNPTQFNDAKDFEKYPVTTGNDIYLLEKTGCNIVFLPSVEEIYPDGTTTASYYDLGELETLLEGKYRPGHFQGVCRVVHRLLDIVEPHKFFLGQKDYQQCMALARLVELLQKNIELVISSTKREDNGLAMSSRNMRLSDQQRNDAAAIFKMLNHIKDNLTNQSPQVLEQHATDYLLQHGFSKVDYVSIADAHSLQPLNGNSNDTKAVALIAAFIGDVRLIDNLILRN